MKKIWGWIIGVALVAVLIFYIVNNNFAASSTAGTTGAGNGATGTGSGSTATTGGTGTTTVAGSGTGSSGSGTGNTGTGSTTGLKDGTYTGPVTDAVYGKLEVVVTIKNGKIVDTECPIQPNAPGHTTQVSQSALPQLKQEAIAAQSANVSVVSGATQTSEAYQQSLAAALTQAQS